MDEGVLRRKSGSKWVEMVGGRRKLHNEELCNSYSSPNVIRMINREQWQALVVTVINCRVP
jgi:hypothetical protein